MKIVIATPLYPPEIEGSAPYVKELAKRLASEQEVVVVTYGRLPEEIPCIEILAVNKHQPLLFRLLAYTSALWKAVKKADILYFQNGASVELPVLLISFISTSPIHMGISDVRAHQHAEKRPILSLIERVVMKRARTITTDLPLPRPTIIPFENYPTRAMEAYERSWGIHMSSLNNSFHHE